MSNERITTASFAEEALPELDAVYRYALRLSGAPDEAEDLAQETFLRAFRSWDSYTSGTRIRSWLFTICRNLFFRARERAGRQVQIMAEVVEEDPRQVSREAVVFMASRDQDPEGAFWSQMIDDDILRAVDGLPPEFREAVVLSDLEGLPYGEIAMILGVPVGTVKSRVFRGRRLLQEQLYDYAVETGILSADPTGTRRRARGGER
jgi:RNA polymerase sigma-70 factor, ECF subfamily